MPRACSADYETYGEELPVVIGVEYLLGRVQDDILTAEVSKPCGKGLFRKANLHI